MNETIKILQFGEGNFLRAFVDYMIHTANNQNVFEGNVAIVKPIPYGNLDAFKRQNCQYTLITRGLQNGEVINTKAQIGSIKEAICAYKDYDSFMEYGKSRQLRFIISNTTEAGISLDDLDRLSDCPPVSYPAKLTKLLYERFIFFKGDINKGLYIIPCELIENNGDNLLKCVIQTAENWELGSEFINWVKNACFFLNTLVDRIVTGFPKENVEIFSKDLGYNDDLLDICEPFALWVIEDKGNIRNELPLDKAGLPVVFTNDVSPYRERKVRILNGAHTSTVLAGYLCGKKIVRECMEDEVISAFMKNCLFEEIIPTLTLPKDDLYDFANSVIERFSNPFIDHSILSISLNSISKWRSRVLCSFKDYYNTNHSIPKLIVFSFSALLRFYMSDIHKDNSLIGCVNGEEYMICDSDSVLRFFKEKTHLFNIGELTIKDFVKEAAGNISFWGEDLNPYDNFASLSEK